MEESTDAHMETDVSSTTEDVPETQEVTGSNGNVEMVIVVEKVIEDQINDNVENNQKQLSPVSETTHELSKSKESPSMDIVVQIIATNSPVKEMEVVEYPSQTEPCQKFVNKNLLLNSELELSAQLQRIEDADSSMTDPLPIENEDKLKLVQTSPKKVQCEFTGNNSKKDSPKQDVLKPDQMSPTKELQLNDSSITSPTNVTKLVQMSPTKESHSNDPTVTTPTNEPQNVIKPAQLSPNKDLQLNDLTVTTPTNETHNVTKPVQKSPTKELQVNNSTITTPTKEPQGVTNPVQMSPTKELQLNNSTITTPTKEPQGVTNPVQISPTKELQLNNSTKTTPTKEPQGVTNPVQISPTKELQLNNSTKTTPTKEPQGVTNPVQMSPTKELQLKDLTVVTSATEPMLRDKSIINGVIQSTDTKDDSTTDSIDRSTIIPIDITIERETLDYSQIEIETNCSDTSEKDHNKSISRELKSLINSAKESKIISECTQLTSKTRKSRSALDTSSTSLNTSIEADKIQGLRRLSNNSQKSSCSEKSEKVAVKRSMRSQNPEFVSKVKQFLNSVTGKGHKDPDEDHDVEEKGKEKGTKDKNESPPKIKKIESPVPDKPGKLRSDSHCWRCHWVVEQTSIMPCTVCPRSFHYKCLSSSEKNKISDQKSWVCPECMIILQAEGSETRSPAMKKISLGMLCDLLKYALERMMDINGVEPFMQPVDRASFPDYDKYVVHPMDLSLMQANIAEGLYGSTAAFLADAQWILHNSIIFNTLQAKLTAAARALVRSCRAETAEIEACPECYAAAHARKPTWFTDVCTTPHILLWAKLKGFPYWPAKGMSVSNAGHVDVRFFGAHDRAWVPAKDCFLYSEKDPNNFRTKRQDIIDSMQEAEQHIRNISRKYGKFVYPAFKTPFNASKLSEQLKMMIPSFEGEVRSSQKDKPSSSPAASKEKMRTYSKCSKKSFTEGDNSDNESEQSTNVASRKMADGAEIAREEDISSDKPEAMEVDTTTKVSEPPQQRQAQTTKTSKSSNPPFQRSKSIGPSSKSNKYWESSRKRRRSDLEEAVITIIETSSSSPQPKRMKSENRHEKEKRKSEVQEPSSSKEVGQKLVVKPKKNDQEETKKDEAISKDNEPSSSTKTDSDKEKNQRVTPIRIAFVLKDKHHNLRTSTAKEAMAKILNPTKEKDRQKDNEKTTPVKHKHSKTEKTGDKPSKDDRLARSEKRRNSRNKSLTNTPKKDKPRRTSSEKKSERTSKSESETTNSVNDKCKEPIDKPKENSATKEKDIETDKSRKDKQSSPKPNSENVLSVKDRLLFDDDTSLAIIARESGPVIIPSNVSGLPTISCVRSLSTTAQNIGTTTTKTTNAKTSEIPVVTNTNSSIITLTAESDQNDATSKLQKLRNDAEPMVGRVGVRAFARMTSPEKSPNKNDDVQIEIKAEPIDVDDADRQIEKMNLMNAFRLQPVNPPNTASNLREVRINKVLVTSLNAKKAPSKTIDVRPRPKKTFPQPKKPEDGQLNSKNSMVYIPIQPPMTQAPVRPPRVVAGPTCPPAKPMISTSLSTNSLVNTVTTPVMQGSSISTSSFSTTATTSSSKSLAAMAQVQAAVQTVPVMTSVNGQWMFSFQPVMSVGALDSSRSPPILNGVAERGNSAPGLMPLSGGTSQSMQPLQVTSGPVNVSGSSLLLPAASKAPGETGTPGEPPRLQQRPVTQLLNPLDPNTPIGTVPTPSSAGPLTAKLNQNAVKLTDFFRTLLEDSLEKLEEPATQLTTARLQLEQAKWKHQVEIEEMKHNHELMLAEMRQVCEKEKLRAVTEARRSAQVELEAAVKVAKSKQWCANCSQEAQFYCCWNTSYCDYPCQRAHWSQHFNVCAQQRQDGSNNSEPPAPTETRLQSQPDNIPKNPSAPTLTVGGKLAPSRVYTQDTNSVNSQKNAIIVSMLEDQTSNPTMKCVGTYKSPVPAQNVSPIILNKQIMNSEETANKKVVSSGGYLIVGGGSSSSSVVTPARRTHTIQYYT